MAPVETPDAPWVQRPASVIPLIAPSSGQPAIYFPDRTCESAHWQAMRLRNVAFTWDRAKASDGVVTDRLAELADQLREIAAELLALDEREARFNAAAEAVAARNDAAHAMAAE